MKQRVLITGGAGFIGSHVVDAFLKRGDAVTILDIKSPEQAPNVAHVVDQITYVTGDIRDHELVFQLCREQDVVVHLAAVVSVPRTIAEPLQSHDHNVVGTLNVFEAAAQAQLDRVVYASSAAVYGNTALVPTPETVPVSPCSPYALHKCSNEYYAAYYASQRALSTIGLRFFNVYGSRQDPQSPYSGVISIFADKIRNQTPPTIFGDGEQTRDFIHVQDIVSAIVTATVRPVVPATLVYNVGTGQATSLNQLWSTLCTVAGVTLPVTYAPQRPGDVRHSCSDISLLTRELGFAPQWSLSDGLRELLAV